MIYHLLPGAESFSMFSGLALARDVANMMRFDESAIVVCREADDSWGFPADRSLVIPQMRIFGRMKGRKYIPRAITTPFFRHIFKPFLAALKSGDIVWVPQPAILERCAGAIHPCQGCEVGLSCA